MKFVKKLKKQEEKQLKEILKTSSDHKKRQRAHAILLSARKHKIDMIAQIFDVDRDTVSEWINRWETIGIVGLSDAPRSGRPPKEKVEQ